ncbi:hypothetical protein [Pedobacter sp. UC225_65]|uniref:hypothetical protein n=1 Tax=Pedobacter sp. UC225_65 TaxID=3350173 RepID=UPI00366E8A1B
MVDLKLNSPQLSLSEFMSFLGPRKSVKRKPPTKNSIKEVSDQLNAVLEASKMNIQLTVNKAIYNRFVATNLNASISLLGDGVYFNKINVNHAGGSLNLTGNIKQSGAINKFVINSVNQQGKCKGFLLCFRQLWTNLHHQQKLEGLPLC